MNELIYKQNQTDREQTCGCHWGRMGEQDSQRLWDQPVHTAAFKTDNQQCPIAHGTVLNVMWQLEWVRMDTYICMAESLCCPTETITALLIGYDPM